MKTLTMLLLTLCLAWSAPGPDVDDLTLSEEILTVFTGIFAYTTLQAASWDVTQVSSDMAIMTGVVVTARVIVHIARWIKLQEVTTNGQKSIRQGPGARPGNWHLERAFDSVWYRGRHDSVAVAGSEQDTVPGSWKHLSAN